MSDKVALVIGIGPGLGASVARRFAREGFAVGLVARGEEKLGPVADAIAKAGGRALAMVADTTDPPAVGNVLTRTKKELGTPTVLVYNAGAFQMGGILEITPEDFERCWRANCYGGFLCARETLPSMLAAGGGTMLFSSATAALRGSARFSCLAVGKFGLRALAQSIAREFGPRGIHVAHVVIDGQIDTPRMRAMMPGRETSTMLSPDAIAETYWHLHSQHPTAWTLEADLRPAAEKF